MELSQEVFHFGYFLAFCFLLLCVYIGGSEGWRCEEVCDLFHNELVEEPVKTRWMKTMLGPSPDGCHFKGHTIFQHTADLLAGSRQTEIPHCALECTFANPVIWSLKPSPQWGARGGSGVQQLVISVFPPGRWGKAMHFWKLRSRQHCILLPSRESILAASSARPLMSPVYSSCLACPPFNILFSLYIKIQDSNDQIFFSGLDSREVFSGLYDSLRGRKKQAPFFFFFFFYFLGKATQGLNPKS
eukprot:bmy_00504T0